MPAPPGEARLELDLSGLADTNALAARLASLAEPGDLIGLSGELGAGKTAFARAFITARAAAAGAEIDEVPSPTFTLVQTYELGPDTVWHFDLYRLDRAEDVYELGIEDALADGIVLIEWPERMAALLPDDRLDIELRFADNAEGRWAVLVGRGGWAERLASIGPEAAPGGGAGS